MLVLLVAPAWAEPSSVLAIGDGLVAGAPAASGTASPTMPGGWVPVLADCLQERAPQQFTVVDRVSPGETIASAREGAAGQRELGSGVVVVALGARELGEDWKPGPTKTALQDLLAALAPKAAKNERPKVLLVPALPPLVRQAEGGAATDEALQTKIDARVAAYDKLLADLAKGDSAIVRVDLLSDWPKDDEARQALTAGGWALSDQGHARVAAAVCEAIVGK